MLLLALVCANLLVRFPRTDHETGIDSFFIHNLATAVSDEGRIPWVLNALGYLGWYPLSYPSAGPLLISGVAQVTGLTEEGAILDLSVLYGVLGALAAFVMARAFRRDDTFALVVAVFFSLAPRFMSFTLWSASSRNLFMVLIPIFVWTLVRSYRRPTLPNFLVLVSVLVLMIATHRLTILLAVVVIAFVVAYVFILANRVVRIRFPKVLLSQRVRRWTPRLAILGILTIAAVMLVGTKVLDEYGSGEICSGTSVSDQLCNLGVSITRSVGLALPFALFGVMEVVRQRHKGFLEAFLIFCLLALVPTLFLRQYTGFYILPFLALFGAFGILYFMRVLTKFRRARSAVTVASILIVSGFGLGVLQVEVERGTSLMSSTYSIGVYVLYLPPGNFVTNDGLLGIRVSAVSGRQGIPVGGAGTTSQSPELLIMETLTAAEVQSKERRIPLTDLTIEDDSPFYLVDIDARDDWIARILRVDVAEVSNRTLNRYGLVYYIENDSLRGGYTAYGNVYRGGVDSIFSLSVQQKRYRLFDGNLEDIYLTFGTPRSP